METTAAAAAACPVPHSTASDAPIAVPPKPYSTASDRLQQQGKEEDQRWSEEKISSLPKNAHILLSILAVATVAVSWYSASQPELLVWRLSLLLCVSAFIASRLLDATVKHAAAMLLVILTGFAAALYLDADPTIGVLLAHLTSHLAAGMLGYALARHRQRSGLEVTPATATPPQKLSDKQEKNAIHTTILGWCYMGVVTAVCAARMACVVWYRAEYTTEFLVLHAGGPMAFALLLWSMFVGVMLLRDDVFIGEMGLGLLGGLLVSVQLLFLVSWIVLGDVGAMVITWLGLLVWTGWFGYSLCVYNSFKLEEVAEARAAAELSELPKIIDELPVPENITSSIHPIQIIDA